MANDECALLDNLCVLELLEKSVWKSFFARNKHRLGWSYNNEKSSLML